MLSYLSWDLAPHSPVVQLTLGGENQAASIHDLGEVKVLRHHVVACPSEGDFLAQLE